MDTNPSASGFGPSLGPLSRRLPLVAKSNLRAPRLLRAPSWSGLLLPSLVLFSVTAYPEDLSYCQRLSPLMQAALAVLPAELSISCDASHIVEITDVDVFLKQYFDANPRLSRDPASATFSADIRNAYAFVMGLQYPIYVNTGRYKKEREGYVNGNLWLAYAFAPLLAHERVHAQGDPRESVAHTVELETAIMFIDRGGLPREKYDVKALKAVIAMEKQAEHLH